jgi:hypothetical protein
MSNQVKIHWTTAERKGSYSWVDPDRAEREIAEGNAVADVPAPTKSKKTTEPDNG